MGKLSRDKGARVEREIVNRLIAEGLDAVRVPLSGATTYAKGDIDIRLPFATMVGEVKARKVFPEWLEIALGENDWLAVRPDRQPPMIIMPFDRFAWLLRKAGGIPEPATEAAE